MADRFAYWYFMSQEIDRIRAVVPAHVRYWKEQAPEGYEGGPFADRSGGLIVFEAGTQVEAERLVDGDPFVGERVLASRWLKKWAVE